MQILQVKDTGNNYQYKWPDNTIENYPNWISYQVRSKQGFREVLIAFGARKVYGKETARAIVPQRTVSDILTRVTWAEKGGCIDRGSSDSTSASTQEVKCGRR